MLARHVSDLIGPSSGAFVYKLYVQIWYVVTCVLPDTPSRYEDDTRSLQHQVNNCPTGKIIHVHEIIKMSSFYNFVTAGRAEQYAYYHIPNSAYTACKTLLKMDR